MEDLLNGLLMPSSDAIKAASAQLKAALKADSVKAVGELCRVMASSQTPQVLNRIGKRATCSLPMISF